MYIADTTLLGVRLLSIDIKLLVSVNRMSCMILQPVNINLSLMVIFMVSNLYDFRLPVFDLLYQSCMIDVSWLFVWFLIFMSSSF